MRWQQDNLDDHDAPTEPIMPLKPSPFSATMADERIPTPIPQERPFPSQPTLSPPFFLNLPAHVPGPAQPPVYPVLPSAPIYNGRRLSPAQKRRSALPLFVGVFFVGVQLLLLVRFVLKLLAFDSGTTWVAVVYIISSVFVLPFRLLLQSIALPIPSAFEIYTLIAILMYGLFSRLLVRLLKALLRSR